MPCCIVNTDGNLHRLISLCNRADLIISTDTSLIHIASALDKPLLGIYPNDPVKSVEWAPRCTFSSTSSTEKTKMLSAVCESTTSKRLQRGAQSTDITGTLG